MGVMAARRKRSPAWEEVPPEPVPIRDLRDLRERIDTGHRKAEVINGELVVSPIPVIWHEKVCDWYAKVTTVIAGEKLRNPAPFNLTLDTSSLPLPD